MHCSAVVYCCDAVQICRAADIRTLFTLLVLLIFLCFSSLLYCWYSPVFQLYCTDGTLLKFILMQTLLLCTDSHAADIHKLFRLLVLLIFLRCSDFWCCWYSYTVQIARAADILTLFRLLVLLILMLFPSFTVPANSSNLPDWALKWQELRICSIHLLAG
jgi:hypothetical protein